MEFISGLIDTMFRPNMQFRNTIFRCWLFKSMAVKVAFAIIWKERIYVQRIERSGHVWNGKFLEIGE